MTASPSPYWDPLSARLAGALYLAIAVCGAFSMGFVSAQIPASDPATSVANLLAHPGLFKMGVLADSAVILCELAVTAILYQMFRHLSPTVAMLALITRAGVVAIMGGNLLIWVMPTLILQQADGPHAATLVQLCFDAHAMGIFVWQLFFGLHLLALGWLIVKSEIVPHLLGWGMIVGAFGYLLQGLVKLSFTQIAVLDMLSNGLLVIVAVSEIGFGLWLLLRGGRRSMRAAPADL